MGPASDKSVTQVVSLAVLSLGATSRKALGVLALSPLHPQTFLSTLEQLFPLFVTLCSSNFLPVLYILGIANSILISTFFLANALLEMLVLEWDHFSFIIFTTTHIWEVYTVLENILPKPICMKTSVLVIYLSL